MLTTHTRIPASVLLITTFTACYSWTTLEESPADVVRAHAPKEVQVVLTDSARLHLLDPRVQGDTLYGRDVTSHRELWTEAHGGSEAGIALSAAGGEAWRAIPLFRVSKVLVKREDSFAEGALAGTLGVAGAIAFILILNNSWNGWLNQN